MSGAPVQGAAELAAAALPVEERIARRCAELVLEALRAAPAAPEKPAPTRASKADVARHYGRSEATIDRWCAEGMPFARIGERKVFDLAACDAWHARPREQGAPARAAPTLAPVRVLTRKAGGR